MAYPEHEILATSAKEGRGKIEFWWVGPPGERGAKVVKTDEFGMRWTLDVGNTHWVTQRVAAGLLGVSVMTINKWVRERKLGKTMLRNGVSVISMRVLEKIAEGRGVFLRSQG